MKFVCERCHTKYSIADEKVRGKVLKVRCKSCEHVITVRESGATIDEPAGAASKEKEAPQSRSGTLDAGEPRAHRVAEPAHRSSSAASGVRAAGLPAAAFHDLNAPAVAPPPRRSIPTPVPAPTPPPIVDDGVEWYLAVDGAQTGPFTRSILVNKILTVPPAGDVHVWSAVLGDWKPPSDVPDLHADVQRRRRPLPTQARRPPTGPVPTLAARAEAPAASRATVSNGLSLASETGEKHVAKASQHHQGGKQNGFAPGPSSDNTVVKQAGVFGLEDFFGDGSGVAKPSPVVAPATLTASPTSISQSQPIVLGAPHPVGVGVSAPARVAGRQVKLIGGAVALVVIVCGIVAVAVLRKPDAPTTVASPPPQTSPTDFSDLAAKLAQEEAAKVKAAPPPVAPTAVEPKPDPVKVDGKADSKTSRNKGHNNKRGLGTSPTSPPPVGGMTPEQIQAANRFAESSGREVRAGSQAAPSARSTPSQADISRVINSNRQGIQTCYQRALLRDSTLTQGKVTVRVSIGLSGKVKSVSLDAPLPFRSMEPCVRDVMSRWAFPPSSEEYGTEFPVVLQGNQ